MAEIHKSGTVEAPAEKIFGILDDPAAVPNYVPNVSDVVDVRRSEARLGDSYTVVYKVLGVTFREKFTVSTYQRPNRLTYTFEGPMHGTYDYSLETQGEQTKVNVDINYQLPGGAIGKAIDSMVLERTNEKTIDGLLENLHRLVTQGAPK